MISERSRDTEWSNDAEKPCPSLYGQHVPILWWLLPAG